MLHHGSSIVPLPTSPTPMTKRLQAQAHTYRANCHTFSFSPRVRRSYGKIASSRVYIADDALWNIEPAHIHQTKLYSKQMNSS